MKVYDEEVMTTVDNLCNGYKHCINKKYNPKDNDCKDCINDAYEGIEQTIKHTNKETQNHE